MENIIKIQRENRTTSEEKLLNLFLTSKAGSLYECSEENADVKIFDNSEFVYYSVKNHRFSDRIVLNEKGEFWFAERFNGRVIKNALV